MIGAPGKAIKWMYYPLEVILTCVRCYVAYPLSLRRIKEMRNERAVLVDHATEHRWAIEIVPVLSAVFRPRNRPVDKSWRMNEPYVIATKQWQHLYRAVDRDGQTIQVLRRPTDARAP